MGFSSTETSDSSSDDEPGSEMSERNIAEVPQIILRKYQDLLPPMDKVYGCEPKEPDQEDLDMYVFSYKTQILKRVRKN